MNEPKLAYMQQTSIFHDSHSFIFSPSPIKKIALLYGGLEQSSYTLTLTEGKYKSLNNRKTRIPDPFNITKIIFIFIFQFIKLELNKLMLRIVN